MKITLISLDKLVADLINKQFFGKITINFNNGVITHIVKEETFKIQSDA